MLSIAFSITTDHDFLHRFYGQPLRTISRLHLFVKLQMVAIKSGVAKVSESTVMKTLTDVHVQAYGSNQRYDCAQYTFNKFSHSSDILLGVLKQSRRRYLERFFADVNRV